MTCLEDCLFLTVTKAKFNKFVSLAPDLMQHFTSLVPAKFACWGVLHSAPCRCFRCVILIAVPANRSLGLPAYDSAAWQC